MKVIFANSAFVDAPERFVQRSGRWSRIALRVRYALVRHPTVGAILIDTGYTHHALQGPGRSLGLRIYGQALRPRLVAAEQPLAILARFGLAAADIRAVIISHFHADHISGLRLFPQARLIAHGAAWTQVARANYATNARHGIFTELLPTDFGTRIEAVEAKPYWSQAGDLFGACHDLLGDGSMIAVDLPGHAHGHFGILFPQMARPLLYGVDTQWVAPAMAPGMAPGYPARLIAHDAARIASSTRTLQGFMATGGEVVLCHQPDLTSHDDVA
jgi:glyoxylase-like metal-dependent hydrolase (beta-lactamase superfamily II)